MTDDRDHPHPRDADDAEASRLLETCLDARALLTLDAAVVLRQTGALIGEALPGATVVVTRLDSPDAMNADFDEASLRLLTAAVADLAVCRASAAEGELIAVPFVSEPDPADPIGRRSALGAAVITAPHPVDEGSLELVRLIADRAALALEHAALYETQEAVAHRLQHLLVPAAPPDVEGLDLGVLFRSATRGAEIGGDFFDFTAFSPGHLLIGIGDVSGKGIEAASATIMAKYALRALVRTARWPTWPGDVLRDLHNALQDQLEPPRFATVALVMIDAVHGAMLVASAGHPGPVVVRADSVERPMLITAPAIALTGASELEPYPTERIELSAGDTVVLYTDGIAELRDADGGFYDDVRLEQALQELRGAPPQVLVERLAADAAAFSARAPRDDIAIVAARLR